MNGEKKVTMRNFRGACHSWLSTNNVGKILEGANPKGNHEYTIDDHMTLYCKDIVWDMYLKLSKFFI